MGGSGGCGGKGGGGGGGDGGGGGNGADGGGGGGGGGNLTYNDVVGEVVLPRRSCNGVCPGPPRNEHWRRV